MSVDDVIFEKKYSSIRTYSNRTQKIYNMKWKSRQDAGSENDQEILQIARYT